MSEEMKPAQPEKVEVFSQTETMGGAVAPAAIDLQETPVVAAPARKGRAIDLSKSTPEEVKAHKKAINDKAQKNRSGLRYES